MTAKRMISTLALCAIVLLLIGCNMGCTTAEDRTYSREVRSVLRQASRLESAFQMRGDGDSLVELPNDYASASAPLKTIEAFGESVKALPTPRSRSLRYLHMRLRNVAQCAGDLQLVHGSYAACVSVRDNPAFDDVAYDRSKFVETTRFNAQLRWRQLRESLAILAAAERVCLGTSMLWDIELADAIGPGTGVIPNSQDSRAADSALAAHEKLVHVEIKRIR